MPNDQSDILTEPERLRVYAATGMDMRITPAGVRKLADLLEKVHRLRLINRFRAKAVKDREDGLFRNLLLWYCFLFFCATAVEIALT